MISQNELIFLISQNQGDFYGVPFYYKSLFYKIELVISLNILRYHINIVCDIYKKYLVTQYQPMTIISTRVKALGLILGSRVDTSGDNQNVVR